MEPKIAAVIEAAKMDNFASLIKSGSEKANSVIKMDMVKPMPARTEQPNNSDQVMPLPSLWTTSSPACAPPWPSPA